jgi:hypothetical protein
MICPDCQGSGRIRKRFLIFFTRNAQCRRCLGTGTYPPAFRPQVRLTRTPGGRNWDDDQWPTSPTFGSTSASATQDRDSFEVGSGGRSGGGGATASWDTPGEAPPVIADPFSGGSSAVTGAASADAADSTASSDPSSASESSDGGGTSY